MEEVKVGNVVFGGGELVLIGGPCQAESLELCCEVAGYLQGLCAEAGVQYVFKASYDKANRSSEGGVRGPGLKRGLEILAAVKQRYGVPVITDVHETVEVPKVAEVADILQIPAFLCRQTDLLHAAGRSGRAVNIKKGQFMAPEDMRGAIEKVRATGNDKLLLTERGTTFGYHNLVVDMRSAYRWCSTRRIRFSFRADSAMRPAAAGNSFSRWPGRRRRSGSTRCSRRCIRVRTKPFRTGRIRSISIRSGKS